MRTRLWLLPLLLSSMTLPLLADEDEGAAAGEGGYRAVPLQADPRWQSECSACHIAYPPGLLPAESWRRIMAGPDRHFGQNASLDEESVRRISEFLVRHSADQGRAGAGGEPPLRITETAWFRREHDEIALATFQRLAIGGPGNCAACHQGAERGRFDEHSVRIPR